METTTPGSGTASSAMRFEGARANNKGRSAWHRLLTDKMAVVALIILAIFVVLALTASVSSEYVTKHQPNALNLMNRFLPPSSTYWLGTDAVGRDVLTRLLYGARISLGIGVLAGAVAITVGSVLGAMAAYFSRYVDDIISAAINTLLSIPTLFLLILLAAFVRPTPILIAVIIGCVSWMGVARLVRGEVLAIKPRDYVTAARVYGATDLRMIFRHILPNTASIVIVATYIDIANAILAESALSFLGLGVQPPNASWGTMLQDSLTYLFQKPFLIFPPGIAIFVTVLCLYVLGDGLRDALDPKLVGS